MAAAAAGVRAALGLRAAAGGAVRVHGGLVGASRAAGAPGGPRGASTSAPAAGSATSAPASQPPPPPGAMPSPGEVERVAARIFGTHLGDGRRSGRKILRRALVGERLEAWYPTHLGVKDVLFQDPKIERRKMKVERLRRRGKVIPKKGEGKRASKRK